MIKEGQQNVPNQLFTDSPWPTSVNGDVSVCFDKDIPYFHTYGNKESVPYWQENRQPFVRWTGT